MCFANQYVMASFASSLAAGVTVCLCCKLIYIIHMHFAKQYMMASFAFSFAAGAAVYLHCKRVTDAHAFCKAIHHGIL